MSIEDHTMMNLKRITASAVAVAAIAAAVGLTTAAPASAKPGLLTLCSSGNYPSQIEIGSGWKSPRAVVNNCVSADIGTGNGTFSMTIVGFDSAGKKFTVTTAKVSQQLGGTVTTFGSKDHRWASTPRMPATPR